MSLTLVDSVAGFEENLNSHNYSFFCVLAEGGLSISEKVLVNKAIAASKGQSIKDIIAFYPDAFSELNAFFEHAFSAKKNWYFSFVSKVPLSITNFSDIQDVFLIRATIKNSPRLNLIVLCKDKLLYRFLRFTFFGESKPKFLGPKRQAWLRFVRTFLRTAFNFKPVKKCKKLIVSLTTKPNEAVDPYFSTLLQSLSQSQPTALVYLSAGAQFILPSTSSRYPIEAFASPIDVIVACYLSIKGLYASPSGLQDCKVQPFFNDMTHYLMDIETIHGDYFYHLFLSRCFKKVIASLRPETIVYPFENRSWEKLLLKHAYDGKVNDVVGYQHSSITSRHFALKIKDADVERMPIPTKVITIGDVTYRWLTLHSPVLSRRLVKGGSLRRVSKKLPFPENKNLLVAISSSRDEARNLLKMVHAISGNISSKIIIRSHPTIVIDDLYAMFTWPKTVEVSKRGSLLEDLSVCFAVVYNSSTVAIEGMLSGRFPIYFHYPNLVDSDPIVEEPPYKMTINHVKEFQKKWEDLLSLKEDELLKLQFANATFAESYMGSTTPAKFAEILCEK